MQMQRKQQGFTLIELVAVIVVLGILASVALPKFFGLQGEARAAAVNAAKANLAGSASMTHAKMLTTNNMGYSFDGVGPIQWSAHNPTGESAGLIAGLNTVSGGAVNMMGMWAGSIGQSTSDWVYVPPNTAIGTGTGAVTLANTGNAANGRGNQHAWLPSSVASNGTTGMNSNCYVIYEDATISGSLAGTAVVVGPTITSNTSGCSASGM